MKINISYFPFIINKKTALFAFAIDKSLSPPAGGRDEEKIPNLSMPNAPKNEVQSASPARDLMKFVSADVDTLPSSPTLTAPYIQTSREPAASV